MGGGGVDEELLNESGDASPQKIIAALQGRLDQAHRKAQQLEEALQDARMQLFESRQCEKLRWKQWQTSQMAAEEATTRLVATMESLQASQGRERRLQAEVDMQRNQLVRAGHLTK